jgi:hypothetical protein
MEHKVDIPWPLRIVPHEILVSLRPFLLRIAREHALQTDAYAFDVVDGRPAGAVEQVEADDAVGVDVWVPGYGVGVVFLEDYFGGLRWVSMSRRKGRCTKRGNVLRWGIVD